ncbi:hypothetical protein JOY44_12730 [Phormidium sp. CLA17]|uniref:hypothetical protein n=1 Tax=Leptolyngbya sp. Cla-17 TaxID=2803751 RepID=UPI001491926F|nr:hypothetical protein [Leptolyngbya sp. Cla-17]MBM0742470.1 hypothetical protein [Leptolyngbya sp. Cla-17]
MAGSSSSNRPLNAVNLLSAAVKLYRSRLNQLLSVAFTATLWNLPPLLAALVLAGVTGFVITTSPNSVGLVSLLSIVLWLGWIVLVLYCYAKSLMNTALISRLAYGELISHPESIQESRGHLDRKTWKFLWTSVLVGLILFVVSFSINIAVAIAVSLVEGVFGETSALAGLVSLVLNLAALVTAYWLQVCLFISEVPLAVETKNSSVESIRRGWELSRGAAGQIFLAIMLAGLITLPLIILAFIPFILTLIANISLLVVASQGQIPAQAAVVALLMSLTISILLVLFLSIFIIPFWQSLKALIYFNLRGWHEGPELQLRDNSLN